MGLERREEKTVLNVMQGADSKPNKSARKIFEAKTRVNSLGEELERKAAFEARARQAMHFPHEWWEDGAHPERRHLLEIVGEHFDDDSEDEMGKARYVKEKCPQYIAMAKELEAERVTHERKRADIAKENVRLKAIGRAPLEDPGEYKPPGREVAEKVARFRKQFHERAYDQMEGLIKEAGFADMGMGSQLGGHDPSHPLVWNQLNASVNNLAM